MSQSEYKNDIAEVGYKIEIENRTLEILNRLLDGEFRTYNSYSEAVVKASDKITSSFDDCYDIVKDNNDCETINSSSDINQAIQTIAFSIVERMINSDISARIKKRFNVSIQTILECFIQCHNCKKIFYGEKQYYSIGGIFYCDECDEKIDEYEKQIRIDRNTNLCTKYLKVFSHENVAIFLLIYEYELRLEKKLKLAKITKTNENFDIKVSTDVVIMESHEQVNLSDLIKLINNMSTELEAL